MPDTNISNEWTSGKVTIIYIIVGSLWILVSDEIVMIFDKESAKITYYQTLKGVLFIMATAAMLYTLIDRGVKKIKKSEIAQWETKKHYVELIENAHDFIYTIDLKCKFTSINRSGEKILGYSRQELLGTSLEEIVSPKHKNIIQKCNRDASFDSSSISEIEFIKKNGHKVLLEVSIRQILKDKQVVGTQGIARDITERRLVEETLQKSETRYKDLIATANEGIIIVNSEGNITFVNQKLCEMLDYDSEELIGNRILDFIDEADDADARLKLEHQVAGFKERFDFKFRKLGGKELWTSISANPIFEDGKFVGSLGMITDISERKFAEEAWLKEKAINESMIDSLPGIFYLYDYNGKFLRWNKNFEKVSGCNSEEMKTKHPLDFFEGEEKKFLEERIDEVFEKGESSAIAHFVSKDGTKTPYFFTGKRIILSDEEFLVGMGIDISEQTMKNYLDKI